MAFHLVVLIAKPTVSFTRSYYSRRNIKNWIEYIRLDRLQHDISAPAICKSFLKYNIHQKANGSTVSVWFFHLLRDYISLCNLAAFTVNTHCLFITQRKSLSDSQCHTTAPSNAKANCSKLFLRTPSCLMNTNNESWKKDSQKKTQMNHSEKLRPLMGEIPLSAF